MKVLLLGVGMQGKAALHDLGQREEVTEIMAADRDFEALGAYVAGKPYAGKVRCEPVDAADPESIHRLMEQGADVVIDLMPVLYHGGVARAAVRHGIVRVKAKIHKDLLNLTWIPFHGALSCIHTGDQAHLAVEGP